MKAKRLRVSVLWKVVGAFVLLVFLTMVFSSSPISASSAQSSQTSAITFQKGSGREGFAASEGVTVMSANDPSGFNSNWYVEKGNGSSGYDFDGMYSNIQYTIGSSFMTFETELGSSLDGGLGNIGTLGGATYALSVNASGTIIPINFWNCTYFSESTSNVTYVENLPTFTNTFTFHDIALETYGNGSSNITLTLTQVFTAYPTLMKVKMETAVDFSNMTLYSPVTQQPISVGTPFSFNLVYYVDASNFTESQIVGHAVNLKPTVTPTSISYSTESGGSLNYSIANMTFSDSFSDFRGTNSLNGTASVYFSPLTGTQGSSSYFVLCSHTFNNLTYRVTTAISSDPTIEIPYTAAAGSSSTGTPNGFPLSIAIIAAVVVAIAVMGAAVVLRHRRSLSS
jgi:hypothetical protein